MFANAQTAQRQHAKIKLHTHAVTRDAMARPDNHPEPAAKRASQLRTASEPTPSANGTAHAPAPGNGKAQSPPLNGTAHTPPPANGTVHSPPARSEAALAAEELRRTVEYWYFCGDGADTRGP